MAELYDVVGNYVWNEYFWLPRNVTWADLKSDESIFIASPADLWNTVPMAVLIFSLRLLWEKFIATPIGRAYNLRDRPPTKPLPSDALEKAFKKYRKVLPRDEKLLKSLSEESGFSHMQLIVWWRRRRAVDKPSEMQRFRETSWRFLFYFGIFFYGLYVLWDAPWFADTKHCWYGYPKHHVPDSIYWYYMIELGFYFSLIISLFKGVKRKDFMEMILHHVATTCLLIFSWGNNMVRMGTLVLCTHDAVDYWLEGAKLAKYLRYHKICDALFLIFTVIWFVTRLMIFPLKVLYTATVQSVEEIGAWPELYVGVSFLILLQGLHIIWTYMIMRIFYAYICSGQVDRDQRSDTEPETVSEDDDVIVKKESLNGKIRIDKGIIPASALSKNNPKKKEE